MKLHELVALGHKIEEMLIAEGGEITPEIEAALSIRTEQLPQTIERYAFIKERLENAAQVWRKKASDMIKIAEACDKTVDKLLDRVDKYMSDLGVEELPGAEHTFKRVKNPPSLKIESDAMIPESLLTIIPAQTKPNNEAIKKALKEGELIPGAYLVQGSRIKLCLKK